MKKILVAMIMVVLATPAFAAIQNVKVSGDITTTWLSRDNFDLGMTNGNDPNSDYSGAPWEPTTTASFQPVGLKKQSVFITQTRLRVDADLSDNVSTTVGLINERAWNGEYGYSYGSAVANLGTDALDTNVQLYLASVTMRELLYSPLTVTVGRQVFNYGNGLVLGDGGVNNQATGNLQYIAQDLTMRTAYDGVKATLDYKPLSIDLIYFKNSQTLVNGNPNSVNTSNNVFGYDANYQLSDPMSTVLETYMFARIDDNENDSTPNFGLTTPYDKTNTMYVPGLRASTNPIKGLNVQGEVAWQLGSIPVYASGPGVGTQLSEHRDAMAAQFLASYSLPVLDKYKPTVNASYTYVSGDKDAYANYHDVPYTSAKYFKAWDPFNENQGSGTIYNSMFPLTNMHIISGGASINPLEDVTASVTWSGLWAVARYTNGSTSYNPLAMYQPDSGPYYLYPTTRNKLGLGDETDINLTYNYTEDVTFGVSFGWFLPGNVFIDGERDTATQAMADVAVKF